MIDNNYLNGVLCMNICLVMKMIVELSKLMMYFSYEKLKIRYEQGWGGKNKNKIVKFDFYFFSKTGKFREEGP